MGILDRMGICVAERRFKLETSSITPMPADAMLVCATFVAQPAEWTL